MKYIDDKLINKAPNKHNLQPSNIKHLTILDWERLKKETWRNNAMKTGEWYCHLEGAGEGFYGDAIDEFWIGFNKKNDKIDYHFSSGEGMLSYRFSKFYDADEIGDRYDLAIQVKAIKWLNKMIDEGILRKEDVQNG